MFDNKENFIARVVLCFFFMIGGIQQAFAQERSADELRSQNRNIPVTSDECQILGGRAAEHTNVATVDNKDAVNRYGVCARTFADAMGVSSLKKSTLLSDKTTLQDGQYLRSGAEAYIRLQGENHSSSPQMVVFKDPINGFELMRNVGELTIDGGAPIIVDVTTDGNGIPSVSRTVPPGAKFSLDLAVRRL